MYLFVSAYVGVLCVSRCGCNVFCVSGGVDVLCLSAPAGIGVLCLSVSVVVGHSVSVDVRILYISRCRGSWSEYICRYVM